jgi:hypothetical protein
MLEAPQVAGLLSQRDLTLSPRRPVADTSDVDVSTTPGATTPLDAPPGQAQVLMLRDALSIERTQANDLMQALPAPSAPPPSLEAGKGASFDAYA